MDVQKDRTERIEKAITKGYQSICREYREKYRQAVESYKGHHEILEDLEKAMGMATTLAQEITGVSDACINDVDIGLMVLYHDTQSKYEERKIKEKRREMKKWPLPFMDANVEEALKLIAEAKKRKDTNEQAVDYYIKENSV